MNLKNHFLIATQGLSDPRFSRSLVYICEHNNDGAMGLIINKPLERFTLGNLLQTLGIEQTMPLPAHNLNQPILYGGPLAEEHGFILHTPQAGFSSSMPLTQALMLTTSKDIMHAIGSPHPPKEFLITLGYSPWHAHQLENEILNNDWLVVEADTHLLFHAPLEQRWKQAALKLGVNITTMTTDIGHA